MKCCNQPPSSPYLYLGDPGDRHHVDGHSEFVVRVMEILITGFDFYVRAA